MLRTVSLVLGLKKEVAALVEPTFLAKVLAKYIKSAIFFNQFFMKTPKYFFRSLCPN